ncbi:hypothetical protein Ato02nite_088330 [Paractinoplanes toevensis]|uniref:Uncharacterized protein n=1 Tax=Paractinoplanes toevensis TaxID=571911 RepID=A0A919WBC3_9ACTN|nr:hypothetical protein Ato02nite_088330 [Actinoplanes toevensis]
MGAPGAEVVALGGQLADQVESDTGLRGAQQQGVRPQAAHLDGGFLEVRGGSDDLEVRNGIEQRPNSVTDEW